MIVKLYNGPPPKPNRCFKCDGRGFYSEPIKWYEFWKLFMKSYVCPECDGSGEPPRKKQDDRDYDIGIL
jgi:DnaJ-class molecular chaperone